MLAQGWLSCDTAALRGEADYLAEEKPPFPLAGWPAEVFRPRRTWSPLMRRAPVQDARCVPGHAKMSVCARFLREAGSQCAVWGTSRGRRKAFWYNARRVSGEEDRICYWNEHNEKGFLPKIWFYFANRHCLSEEEDLQAILVTVVQRLYQRTFPDGCSSDDLETFFRMRRAGQVLLQALLEEIWVAPEWCRAEERVAETASQ